MAVESRDDMDGDVPGDIQYMGPGCGADLGFSTMIDG